VRGRSEPVKVQKGRRTSTVASAHQRAFERFDVADSFVDSSRLTFSVRVHRADDYAQVPGAHGVQPDELPTVQCEDCSIVQHREVQNLLVGDCSVGLSGFLGRQHIVSEPPELLHDFQREILVRVQGRQCLGGLVLADGLLDVFSVRIDVRPGVNQIRRAERGKIRQDLRLGPARPTVALENPHWDSSADDAGDASGDSRRLFNAGPGIANLLSKPLHDGSFFRLAQGGQFGFKRRIHIAIPTILYSATRYSATGVLGSQFGYGCREDAALRPLAYRPRNPRATSFYQLLETHFETLKRLWEERFERRYGITQSLGHMFGSNVMVGDTGLWMMDGMYWFDYDPPGLPNDVAPGKRVSYPIMPTIVLEGGEPVLTIGSPGGIGIVETVPQILMNVLDHRMEIQDAIDAPRVRGMEGLSLIAESRLPQATVEALKSMGHEVELLGDFSPTFGGAQGIAINPRTRVLMGGADPGIPLAEVTAFDEALDAAGVEHEIVVYPGAPHSFFDRKYEEFAADSEDAWQRVLSFLEHNS